MGGASLVPRPVRKSDFSNGPGDEARAEPGNEATHYFMHANFA